VSCAVGWKAADFRFLTVRDRDHAKVVDNEDPPERFAVIFGHVARLKIAEGVYCADGVVDLRRGIDGYQRESFGGLEE
jgi:hypothetical protein